MCGTIRFGGPPRVSRDPFPRPRVIVGLVVAGRGRVEGAREGVVGHVPVGRDLDLDHALGDDGVEPGLEVHLAVRSGSGVLRVERLPEDEDGERGQEEGDALAVCHA